MNPERTIRTTPPTLLADFYKISHRAQYPANTEYVYSNFTARGSRLDGVDEVVCFGFQGFVQEWLIDYFDEQFFGRPKQEVLSEYVRFIAYTLYGGDESKVDASHLDYLHDLGFLPLLIKALPEGMLVPVRVPMLTIENTDPKCFWLTNYIETLFSCSSWHAMTGATIAHEYRKVLDFWAIKTTGSTDGVDFQAHDFSMRGMTDASSAAKCGAGHLLSFYGTDTMPAIVYLENYYGANIAEGIVGTSIPATEHSVMSAGSKDGEYETYRRLIEEIYPSGMVSIVSDTWDLWHVITDTLPRLKDLIMERDGRVVIRPDSGDPVDIICGTDLEPYKDGEHKTPSQKGVIELLWEEFGGTTNEKGYKVLDPHIGAIYGDSITLGRAREMCERLAKKGFASTNIVLGVGSFTYQYVTRDTFECAIKATQVIVDGKEINIFKDPVTDSKHTKRSLTGRVMVVQGEEGEIKAIDGLTMQEQWESSEEDLLGTIFKDGWLMSFQTLERIRERLAASR